MPIREETAPGEGNGVPGRRGSVLRGGDPVPREETFAQQKGHCAPGGGTLCPAEGKLSPGMGTLYPREGTCAQLKGVCALRGDTLCHSEAVSRDGGPCALQMGPCAWQREG